MTQSRSAEIASRRRSSVVTPHAVSGENNAALFLRVRVLVVALLCITAPSVALWVPLDL